MDTTELTSDEFWQSDQCRIMVNPRDDRSLAEAEIIQSWAHKQSALSGHVLFSTSGSSGRSKWAALSRESILASARVVNQFLSASESDIWLLALPDFHVGGMGILARSYTASCQVVYMGGKWDARAYHAMVLTEGVTLSSLVPTQLVDLVQSGLSAPPSLRAVLIGGGRLDDAVYQQAIDLGWPVMETYGMTETCSQVATARLGSRDLKVLSGWQTQISDDGRLMINGEALLTAYVSCHDGLCEIQDPKQEGWFTTGDVVELTANCLLVKGRADRCVKVLGELVNLAEVESAVSNTIENEEISGHESVVTSIPDIRNGSRLVLCSDKDVDLRLELNLEELRLRYNDTCHPVERIESVCLLGEIPRSALGKIRYGELSDLVAGVLVTKEQRK